MISKERIDELLMKRAKIYGIGKQGDIFCLGLKFRPETLKNKKWLENKYEVYSKFFETKEEAEWYKEFGCIERTERLELLTWEEFLKMEKLHSFKSKEGKLIVYFYDNNTIFVEDEDWNILRKPLTKENYTLACRKCKELFLGDSDGDIR